MEWFRDWCTLKSEHIHLVGDRRVLPSGMGKNPSSYMCQTSQETFCCNSGSFNFVGMNTWWVCCVDKITKLHKISCNFRLEGNKTWLFPKRLKTSAGHCTFEYNENYMNVPFSHVLVLVFKKIMLFRTQWRKSIKKKEKTFLPRHNTVQLPHHDFSCSSFPRGNVPVVNGKYICTD